MIKKIKEEWGKFLIWLYGGMPPSMIAELYREEFYEEMRRLK